MRFSICATYCTLSLFAPRDYGSQQFYYIIFTFLLSILSGYFPISSDNFVLMHKKSPAKSGSIALESAGGFWYSITRKGDTDVQVSPPRDASRFCWRGKNAAAQNIFQEDRKHWACLAYESYFQFDGVLWICVPLTGGVVSCRKRGNHDVRY